MTLIGDALIDEYRDGLTLWQIIASINRRTPTCESSSWIPLPTLPRTAVTGRPCSIAARNRHPLSLMPGRAHTCVMRWHPRSAGSVCSQGFDQEQLVGALPLMRGQRWGLRRAGVQRFNLEQVLGAELARAVWSGFRSGGIIPLAADHATYQDRFRAKFHREIKRQERRLKEQAPVVYRLRENTASNLANLKCFAEIEDSGWKGAEGTSIHRMLSLALFAQATEAFDERGWMEWGFLNAGDETMTHRAHLRLFLWKVAYREDYAAYAPSNLLLYRLIGRSRSGLRSNSSTSCATGCGHFAPKAERASTAFYSRLCPVSP